MKKQKVTIREVASLAQVSTATVSYVINSTHNVSPATAERVHQAIEALSYRPNYAARVIKTQKSHIIGVIVPEIDNPFYSGILKNLEETLCRNNYTLFLSSSHDKLDFELQQIDHLASWNADAIILAPSSPSYDYNQVIRSLSCPLIFIDRHPNATNYHGVFSNQRKAFCEAAESLLDAGYEKIAFLAPPPAFPVMQDRLQGYQDAFIKRGLPVDQRFVSLGSASVSHGYEMMEYVVKALRADAAIIANRKLSIGALNYLSDHDLHFPRDIGIIGFGAYGWHKACSPTLTTVFDSLDGFAAALGELLMTLPEKPDQPARQIVLDAYMTSRSSY